VNTRNFRVQGQIACIFSPSGIPPTVSHLPNIEIQLWHMGPLDTVFLGKGITDVDGNFIIDLSIDSPVRYIIDGKINEVNVQIFFNGAAMSSIVPIPAVILNEGFNPLALIEIDITDLQDRKLPDAITPISVSLPIPCNSLFQLYYDLHPPVPTDLEAKFTIYDADGDIAEEITLNPDSEGNLQLNIPLQATVVVKSTGQTLINYYVEGPFDQRNEENYLEVEDVNGSGTNDYTLIWNIHVHDNSLQIQDNLGSFHRWQPITH